jgi:4-carboxymuconolactone decarboxylase
MANPDAQAYIDNVAQAAGKWPRPAYVPDFHKIMANNDLAVLEAYNALGRATYVEQRSLDAKTKELLFLAMFTVLRSGREQLTSHVQMALDQGITAQEILETMELAIPVAGIVAFLPGFEAWREVTRAQGIEPSIAGSNGTAS